MKQKAKPIFNATNKNGTGEVLLYTDIGGFRGITSTEFMDRVNELGNVKNINLRISSEGGSVVTAVEIYNFIQRHAATWNTYIDGIALSSASWIPLATDKIYMAENAQMMIHRVQGIAIGQPDDIRKMADVMEDIENTVIISAYRNKTGLSRGDLIDMMNAETWMNATKAYDLGFVDEITGNMEMAAHARLSGHYNYLNVPTKLVSSNRGNPNKEKTIPKFN